ncbi:MAG: hypothetical protein PVS3B2_07590 [Candidatus Dormibacteraceae bacterium]
MSSSRRLPKRPSRVKSPVKGAPARRATAKLLAKRPTSIAKRPAGRAQGSGARQKKGVSRDTLATESRGAAQKPQAKPPPPSPPKPSVPLPRPGIRLAGSAGSRLTIKAVGPMAPRPQLELSTKRRPSGPRRLSDVELDEDEVLIDEFDAILEGAKVRITAVLERTCVYLDSDGDRRLARKIDLWVEAGKLPIRRRWIG